MSGKYDELMEKLNELIGSKKESEKKCKCKVGWVLAIVGVIAVVAGIAYAVYRYLTPDYLEEFDDDFDDEFDDELFEDEEEEKAEEKKSEAPSES